MRLDDWEQRLLAYIEALDIDALGVAPCARFAADAAQVQTGVDYYAPYRGRYRTETGAAKVLRTIGGGDLPLTFDMHFEQKMPVMAQRGDLIFNGESMGVCLGADAAFIHESALVFLPRQHWLKAWAVG